MNTHADYHEILYRVEQLAITLRVRPSRRFDEMLPIVQRWAERWMRRREPLTVLGTATVPSFYLGPLAVEAHQRASFPFTHRVIAERFAHEDKRVGNDRRERTRARRRLLRDLGETAQRAMLPVRIHFVVRGIRFVAPSHRADVEGMKPRWDKPGGLPDLRIIQFDDTEAVRRAD